MFDLFSFNIHNQNEILSCLLLGISKEYVLPRPDSLASKKLLLMMSLFVLYILQGPVGDGCFVTNLILCGADHCQAPDNEDGGPIPNIPCCERQVVACTSH